MKLVRIRFFVLMCLFVCFSGVNTYANNFRYNSDQFSIDSVAKESIKAVNVKNIINWYQSSLLNDQTNERLLKVAIAYAVVNDSENSTIILNSYIKKTDNIEIINSELFSMINNTKEFINLKNKYLPKLNLFIIYFFAVGIIGLFISVVLNIRKKGNYISNVLISVFLFLHSLFIINLCFFLSNYVYVFPELFPVSISFSFFYGPLIYFYFKRSSEEYRFKKVDILHLLPALILISYLFPNYLLSSADKLHILINRKELFQVDLVVIITLKCISLLTYSIMTYKLYLKNRENRKQDLEITKWRKNLSILNLSYSVVYFLFGASLAFKLSYSFLYPQSLLLSGIVLYIGVIAYVKPKIFSNAYNKNLLKVKYENSGLTDGFSEDLKEQLLLLLNSEKVYRNNKITLNMLSSQLGTTRHNVSQVINEHFGVNFFHLMNKFRVNEAVEIIKSDKNRNLKIIEIAYDVGFNNKVTFNKAFKIETSLTPSQYIENMNKLDLG